MTGSEVLAVALGALGGFALGLGYFASLALTTRRLACTSRPGGLMIVSLMARMALLALGFVVLARLSVWSLLAAVPGVIAARVVLVRRFGPRSAPTPSAAGGVATGVLGQREREEPERG